MKVPLIDLRAQFTALEQEIREALDSVLQRQQFILGDEVRSLEAEMAEFTQTAFAVGCASGTDALMLSMAALGIGAGDEVITTSYSFFATAGMISWMDARPVFVDVDPATFNLRPDAIASKITSRTRAIIAVHLFGQCCDMEELIRFGIPVIEDAAQAIGSTHRDNQAGSMGTSGCFSFFPTKNLGGYGDGGMIVCKDETFANTLRMLRAHGQEGARYHHVRIGTNSRLDEIQAAILRVKLRHLRDWNQKRARNASYYNECLKQLPLQLPVVKKENKSNFHQYVIKTPDRDRLKKYLADQGIGTAIYYPIILPLQPCFSELGHRSGDFPASEKCAETSLAIPVHADLREEQLDYVARNIIQFFQ